MCVCECRAACIQSDSEKGKKKGRGGKKGWLQPAEQKQLPLAVLCCESTFLTGSQARLRGQRGIRMGTHFASPDSCSV